MNRVTKAKKAAEANLIARREETVAMPSHADTTELIADNATLMRLWDLVQVISNSLSSYSMASSSDA